MPLAASANRGNSAKAIAVATIGINPVDLALT
jgi:hypothetical protein